MHWGMGENEDRTFWRWLVIGGRTFHFGGHMVILHFCYVLWEILNTVVKFYWKFHPYIRGFSIDCWCGDCTQIGMMKLVNQTTEMCEEVMDCEGDCKVSILSVNELRYCCLSFNIFSTSTYRVTTPTNKDHSTTPTPGSD